MFVIFASDVGVNVRSAGLSPAKAAAAAVAATASTSTSPSHSERRGRTRRFMEKSLLHRDACLVLNLTTRKREFRRCPSGRCAGLDEPALVREHDRLHA